VYLPKNSVSQHSSLADLAAAARGYDQEFLGHERNALRVALDAGDALSWAKQRCPNRGWKPWRKENCPKISKRKDEMYRQLAAHRPEIERALAEDPDFSIRDALKLIQKPRAPTSESPRAKPASARTEPPLDHWHRLSNNEKRDGLAEDGVPAFLEYMPPNWREELGNQIARVEASHKTARDRELSKRLRQLLRHLLRGDEAEKARWACKALVDYIRDDGIDAELLEARVAAADAPSKRRPPLVSRPSRSPLTVVVNNDHPAPV
jgi:hypothetical protein